MRKADSIESALNEANLLPFSFSRLVLEQGSLALYALGLIQLIAACTLLRSNDARESKPLIWTLLLCLLLDCLIMNNPFVELMREREHAIFEFGLNIGLAGSLLMH